MKTALIIGITGGFGGHMALELHKKGWKIISLVRTPNKVSISIPNMKLIKGDASNLADLRAASAGVDLIVYGANLPYPCWETKALPLLEPSVLVAEEKKLIIVFPGNVYLFNPADGPDFSEQAKIDPVVSKGRIRQKMEARLLQASHNGAKIFIFRAGDFIGENAPSTWLHQLIKPTRFGYSISAAGPKDLLHSWAYLPDLAKTICLTLDHSEQLPAFNVFHFKGYQSTFQDIAAAVKQDQHIDVKIKPFPWILIKIMSPFSSLFRGLIEMRYLWDNQINLNEKKLEQTLHQPIPHTPLADALRHSNLL